MIFLFDYGVHISLNLDYKFYKLKLQTKIFNKKQGDLW